MVVKPVKRRLGVRGTGPDRFPKPMKLQSAARPVDGQPPALNNPKTYCYGFRRPVAQSIQNAQRIKHATPKQTYG